MSGTSCQPCSLYSGLGLCIFDTVSNGMPIVSSSMHTAAATAHSPSGQGTFNVPRRRMRRQHAGTSTRFQTQLPGTALKVCA
jgi:hypothetical protein